MRAGNSIQRGGSDEGRRPELAEHSTGKGRGNGNAAMKYTVFHRNISYLSPYFTPPRPIPVASLGVAGLAVVAAEDGEVRAGDAQQAWG